MGIDDLIVELRQTNELLRQFISMQAAEKMQDADETVSLSRRLEIEELARRGPEYAKQLFKEQCSTNRRRKS